MKRICLVLAILAAFALGYADRPVYDVDMSLQISQSLYGRKKLGDTVGGVGVGYKFYGSAELPLFKWLSFEGNADWVAASTYRQYHNELGEISRKGPDACNDKLDVEGMLKLNISKKWVEPLLLIRGERRLVPRQDDEGHLQDFSQWVIAQGFSREMLDAADKELKLRLVRTFRIKNQRVKYVSYWSEWYPPFEYFSHKKDIGMELSAVYKQAFDKINGKLRSQLRLYQATEKTALDAWVIKDKHKQPLEVNWETNFSVKVWKGIVANASLALRYDIEEIDALQWKQMAGLGIGYILP